MRLVTDVLIAMITIANDRAGRDVGREDHGGETECEQRRRNGVGTGAEHVEQTEVDALRGGNPSDPGRLRGIGRHRCARLGHCALAGPGRTSDAGGDRRAVRPR